MTGPEHYRMAETLLEEVKHFSRDDGSRSEHVAKAQVHATLALAAATADCAAGAISVGGENKRRWDAVREEQS